MKLDISLALMKHTNWVWKLNEFIEGKAKMSSEELLDSHSCQLGQWLYGSSGLQKYTNIEEMWDLEKVHSNLHDAVAEIVSKVENNQIDAARTDLQTIENLSNKIRKILNETNKQL